MDCRNPEGGFGLPLDGLILSGVVGFPAIVCADKPNARIGTFPSDILPALVLDISNLTDVVKVLGKRWACHQNQR
jgi:hypothetical protein